MEKLVSQSWQAYGRGRSDSDLRDQLSEKLNRAKLTTAAVLAETTITVSDLLNMAPGRCDRHRQTRHPPGGDDDRRQEEIPGQPGPVQGKRALKVQRPVTPKDRV
jgi:flagellar motor switch protein FliM